jgi:hypothetical protein
MDMTGRNWSDLSIQALYSRIGAHVNDSAFRMGESTNELVQHS